MLKTELVKGEILLAGTDGMFDNLGDERICKVVASRIILNLSNIAWFIDKKLRTVYLDAEAKTPYAKLSQNNCYRSTRTGWEESLMISSAPYLGSRKTTPIV